MLSWRKTLARWPSILAMLGFLLLLQIQQSLACDLMILSTVKSGQDCFTHDGVPPQKPDKTHKYCCDHVLAHITAGKQCNNDQNTIIYSSIPGKLNPDFQPVFMIVTVPESIIQTQSPASPHTPYYSLSRAGARTYLTTQRLRI